jgi:signal transduction histidine kinase
VITVKEKFKILLIGILLAGCIALVYYFHAVIHTDTLFTHLYYIPIVLSALWWKRKALPVAVFSAALLMYSHLFYLGVWRIVDGCFRALMFIVISIIVAEISENIVKMKEEMEKERNFSDSVIDTVPDFLLILDKDLRIRRANRTFCEKLQKESDKIIGESLYNVLQDKDRKISSELTKIFKKKNMLKDFKVYYHLEGQPSKRVFSISIVRILKEKLVIIWDITKRVRVEEKLRRTLKAIKKHRRDLRRLSNKLIAVQEKESLRISRELHDEMGQIVTAISINLTLIGEALPSELAPMIKERLTEASALIDQVMKKIHELSLDLRPPLLSDFGLVPALRQYVDRYHKRGNIEMKFEAINLEERLAVEVETVIYRVVQESLTNIAKHAQANKVYLRMERKESKVWVFIEDDGKGFDVEEVVKCEDPDRGVGLLGIRERIAPLKGSFSVQSHPGQGTRLYIEIPWRGGL